MPNDTVTELTSDTWLGRLGRSIKGVLVGIGLIVGAIVLLGWNEGRAVQTARGLKELKRLVVSVPADPVDPQVENKPIYVSGAATTRQTLADPEFSVTAVAPKLRRCVQMYQWKEKAQTSTNPAPGGTQLTKTYSYEKAWSEELINSAAFNEAKDHQNPLKMRYAAQQWTGSDVRLGPRRLSPSMLDQWGAYQPLPLTPKQLGPLPEAVRRQAKLKDDILYVPAQACDEPADPENPRIGDLKLSYQIVPAGPVSVIARQAGDSFAPWQSSSGLEVERLMNGSLTAAEMLAAMRVENESTTWALRFAGFLLLVFGLGMIVDPLVVMAETIPILGGLLRAGVGLFAGLSAAALSLFTIALAWLVYRPLVGASLLGGALALLVVLAIIGRAARRSTASPTIELSGVNS